VRLSAGAQIYDDTICFYNIYVIMYRSSLLWRWVGVNIQVLEKL